MEQYIIKGGNPLVGDVTISGAKNAALGILAASIMTDDDVLIDNLPDVRDINVMLEAIQEIGARVDRIDRHTVKINGSGIKEVSVDDEYIRRIRASYYFIGALLGKYKSAQVPLPGGCNIGSRPIDQHIKGFRALGADVQIECGAVIAHAIDLVASHIYLDVVSVGATINIMIYYPYPWRRQASWNRVFYYPGSDRSRYFYVCCSSNQRGYHGEKCDPEASGSYFCQAH